MVHRVLVVIVAAQAGLAQESDFIDTGELAGRGIAFQGTPGARFSIRGLSSVGDVNGDGFSDIGFSHTITNFPLEYDGIYLVFGGPDWPAATGIKARGGVPPWSEGGRPPATAPTRTATMDG